MAEQNPIRYSDLISPDDSIEKLIGQLEQLNTAYTGMANSVKAQAASVAASLKNVSGATEAGRSATKAASDDAKKLEKAYRDLAFARSDTAKKIAELKMAQQEENRITKLTTILNNTEAGSYAHLSAQYGLNKIQLNQLTAAERENLPHAKKLEEETKAIYEEMKRLQEATGKYSLNVGNYENAINNAIGVNSKWFIGLQQIGSLFENGFANGVKAAGSAVTTFGKQLLALLANPVVLTIAAITAAFMALAKGISSSEENTNTLMRILAPFKRILDGVLNVIQDMAGYVLKVVEGFENLAMGASRLMERLPLVGNAFKAVNNALQENIDLEREKQQLQKDNRKLTKEEAKTQYEIAVLRRKAQQTDDPEERTKLLQKAVNKERQMSDNRVAFLKRELAVMKAKAQQTQNDAATNDAIAQKEAEIWNARAAAEQRSLRMVRQIATAERQQKKQKNGSGTKSGTSEADNAKKELELIRKIEDAKISLEENTFVRERMMIMAQYQRKIEDLRTQGEKEVENREHINELITLTEQQMQEKLAEVFEKEAKDQQAKEKKTLDAKVKAIDDMEKAREDAVRKGEQAIAQQYDLDMSYAELENNENKKTQMRLEAEKKRLQALLSLYEKDGKMLTAAEVQSIRNSIQAVDNELEKNKKNKDIFDMLGFNFNDDQKQAMSDAFSFAMENLSSYLDAWVEAADKKRELADAEVERTKNVLQAEIEARANGYANEVETARKEYEEAKKNQQKTIEQQKKAQKAQEAVQTVQQAGNLITASSLIWSQLGFPWAIPAIAIMWGSFAAAKIKAAQVAGSGTEEYGEGTVELLEGGSHQSGNDIDLGRKPDGTRRRAEGGEYFAVINKRNSRKYRDLIPDVINSLNVGTFADKYMNAYDGGAVGVVAQGADLSRLEAGVDRINGNLEKPVMYFDGRGNQVLIYKNVKRVIKN